MNLKKKEVTHKKGNKERNKQYRLREFINNNNKKFKERKNRIPLINFSIIYGMIANLGEISFGFIKSKDKVLR